MKTRFVAFILLLAMLQLACGLSGAPAAQPAAPAAPAQPAPLPVAELASPTATGASAPSETPAPPTETLTPSETPAPSPTPLPPTNTPLPEVPGPELLDLQRIELYLPLLSDYTEAYLDEANITNQGKTLNTMTRYTVRYQSRPLPAWDIKMNVNLFDHNAEQMSVNGKRYTLYSEADCRKGGPAAPQSVLSQLAWQLTGQVQRVEAAVVINGLPADRYALKNENYYPGAQVVLVDRDLEGRSAITTTAELHGEGSLWVARQGGYILRLETTDTVTTLKGKPLPPGTSLSGSRLLNIIPTAPEDEPLTLPAACGALEEAVISGYPMMSDAEMVVKIAPNQSYLTRHELAEVRAFYEQEMAAAGWVLTTTNAIGPLAELTFTKDGKSVRLTLVQTGKTVAVTITDL